MGAAAALLAARAALPYLLSWQANRALAAQPEVSGRVSDVDLGLLAGTAALEGLQIRQKVAGSEDPIFTAERVAIEVDWPALLTGRFLAKVGLDRPAADIVVSTRPERARRAPSDWQAQVEGLFPFRVTNFEVRDGAFRLRDETTNPPVEVRLEEIQAVARGLTNEPRPGEVLPASLRATARAFGSGKAALTLRFDPLAESPTFDLSASLSEVPARALNAFLRAYAKLDAESGTFSFFTEAAAKDGRVRGYVKPMFRELKVFRWREEKKNPLGKFWEALVEGVKEVLENEPTGRLAARIPFEGPIQNPELGIWAAVVSVLRNAFTRALIPSTEGAIGFPPRLEERKE